MKIICTEEVCGNLSVQIDMFLIEVLGFFPLGRQKFHAGMKAE